MDVLRLAPVPGFAAHRFCRLIISKQLCKNKYFFGNSQIPPPLLNTQKICEIGFILLHVRQVVRQNRPRFASQYTPAEYKSGESLDWLFLSYRNPVVGVKGATDDKAEVGEAG